MELRLRHHQSATEERRRDLILTFSTPRRCHRCEHKPVVYLDETRTSIGLMMAYKQKLSINFVFAGGPDDGTSSDSDSNESVESDSDSD